MDSIQRQLVGYMSIDGKYITNPTVYRDWCRWAISNKGGIALSNAFAKVMGNKVIADWYGKGPNPYAIDNTDAPTEEQFTFCGRILATNLTFDIDSRRGVVKFFSYVSDAELQSMKDRVSTILEQVKKILDES